MIFCREIIPEKSKVMHGKYLENSKNSGKFIEIDYNKRSPIKILGGHEKDFWFIEKLYFALGWIGKFPEKSRKNAWEN